ncbi:MAG: AMP-binding protein [Deltaproteobacteria bacterium]|nr:AMP-binding protein [Deltaproteobacteria bacterium]
MEGMNVASHLTAAAARTPSKTALFYPRRSRPAGRVSYRAMTFRELDEESDRIAHGLREIGVGRGCRVLLMVPPGVEFLALTFAVFKLGAVLILIDPGMGKRNLLHCIKEVEPQALIAVPLVHALKRLYRNRFREVKQAITVGRRWFWGGPTLERLRDRAWSRFPMEPVSGEDPAAIFFTTGSTGIPKGVLYLHGMLGAQIRSIQEAFRIGEEEVGFPAFAPFALLCIAMGTTCVLPDMDPTKPAEVDPENILAPIREYGVTYSFGSPAFWNRVSPYCVERGLRLPALRKVLLAGAPVPGELLKRLREILPAGGESYTPYGATEALPVASIAGSEVLAEALERSRQGAGICVGRALPGIALKIIRICDEPIPAWDQSLVLPANGIGEIVVRGPVVTREYYKRAEQTALAKIRDGDSLWHRMGDVGYLDEKGRLWFCGRKNHRVVTAQKTMFTIPCEAIFNQHPSVFRSALVGVGPQSSQRPVIIVEPKDGAMPARARDAERFARELLELAGKSELTRDIRDVLFHRGFPVDFRHNAKIIREQLALWAADKIRGSAGSLRRGKSSP